jgi:5-methylcytosine-specific restriction endonuclease McrA
MVSDTRIRPSETRSPERSPNKMAYDIDDLRKTYNRTNGKCHICWKKLSFNNYGKIGEKGAWEIEHSHPRSKGGSDHLNNLYASCISCNRLKGTHTTQTARSWHNHTKAPLSKTQREEVKCSNAFWGALIFGVVGAAIASPLGIIRGVSVLAGVLLGGIAGYNADPDR